MKNLRWLFVILGILGLIAIRFQENRIFYDPFISYFHEANENAAFPEFVWAKLVFSHVFRFILNLIFSAVIVHFLFLKKEWTIQAMVLMLIVFAIAFPIYLYCISTKFEIGYLFSFYMRRFVIQPIILLLIIPMFYYRKQVLKN